MFLPHSPFRCLVHIQFSSLRVQEANLLHSQELDTALLPSAAHIPRPHSAGNGCTTIQQTGVKLLTAHTKTPTNSELESIPHNQVNHPNVSHAKFGLFVKSLKLCTVVKWGVTLLQLTSYASFSDLQLSFSPPENCVGIKSRKQQTGSVSNLKNSYIAIKIIVNIINIVQQQILINAVPRLERNS